MNVLFSNKYTPRCRITSAACSSFKAWTWPSAPCHTMRGSLQVSYCADKVGVYIPASEPTASLSPGKHSDALASFQLAFHACPTSVVYIQQVRDVAA